MSLANLFTVMNDQGIAQVHPIHPYVLLVNQKSMPTIPLSDLVGKQKPGPNKSGSCKSDIQLIMQGEGFRECKYNDSKGIPTICYGYNLKRSKAASEIKSVGGDY